MKGKSVVNIQKRIQPLVIFALILSVVMWLGGCAAKDSSENVSKQSQAPVKTAVGVVVDSGSSGSLEVMGTVSPGLSAIISAKVMGVIREVRVNEGDPVKTGDVIAVIEDREISARFRQTEAGLKEAIQGEQAANAGWNAAQASADLADATFMRFRALMVTQSVSPQEFEEVEARHRQALSSLEQARSMAAAAKQRVCQAQEALSAAESVLKDTLLTAPFDGKVTDRLVDPGDMAAPGTPLLKIEETKTFEVHFAIPENRINSVHIGDGLSVVIPSQPGSPVTVKVITVDPAADPATRSFRVKAALPEVAGLHSGTFARVLIPIPVEAAGFPVIPETAVFTHGQLTGVFLVDKGNVARFRLIRTGRTLGDRVEVVSGLKQGDRYVIAPNHRISDGTKVEGS
jgi:RND family efflux transporter MFP subunit